MGKAQARKRERREQREASAERTYWHGGPAGLAPGSRLLSPAVTGHTSIPAPELAALAPFDVGRRNRVYFTVDRQMARGHAAAAGIRAGRGALYRVRPDGDVEHDPDFPPGISWCARSALILAVDELDVTMTDQQLSQALNRYNTWDNGSPMYDDAGRVQLSPQMRGLGIRQHTLDALFPAWADYGAVVTELARRFPDRP